MHQMNGSNRKRNGNKLSIATKQVQLKARSGSRLNEQLERPDADVENLRKILENPTTETISESQYLCCCCCLFLSLPLSNSLARSANIVVGQHHSLGIGGRAHAIRAIDE